MVNIGFLLLLAYEELRLSVVRGVDPRNLEEHRRTTRGRHGRMTLMQEDKGYPTFNVESMVIRSLTYYFYFNCGLRQLNQAWIFSAMKEWILAFLFPRTLFCSSSFSYASTEVTLPFRTSERPRNFFFDLSFDAFTLVSEMDCRRRCRGCLVLSTSFTQMSFCDIPMTLRFAFRRSCLAEHQFSRLAPQESIPRNEFDCTVQTFQKIRQSGIMLVLAVRPV